MLLTGSIGNVDRYLLLFDTVKLIGILCVNIGYIGRFERTDIF